MRCLKTVFMSLKRIPIVCCISTNAAGIQAGELGLNNDVLDVSKIESGSVELTETAFNLFDLVHDVVEMIEAKHQSLTLHIDESMDAQVLGDARKLKQVLVNILENASKYTRQEGNICFSLKEVKTNEPHIGTYQFVIEDNGIGMQPDYLKHIFDEPFSRAEDSRISKVPGMNAHLAKPIEPDRLYQTLYDFIYEKEGSADENV